MSIYRAALKETKPCPICGSTTLFMRMNDVECNIISYVECDYCGTQGPMYDSDFCIKKQLNAVEAWNRRSYKLNDVFDLIEYLEKIIHDSEFTEQTLGYYEIERLSLYVNSIRLSHKQPNNQG